MQSLAATSGTVLVEGKESLALMPLTAGLETLQAALATHDTVVAYKGGRVLPEVLAAVRAAGRSEGAILGSALGTARRRHSARRRTRRGLPGALPFDAARDPEPDHAWRLAMSTDL